MPPKRRKTKTTKNRSENMMTESGDYIDSQGPSDETETKGKFNNRSNNEKSVSRPSYDNISSGEYSVQKSRIENESPESIEPNNRRKMKLYREYALHHITPVFYGIGCKNSFISHLGDHFLGDGYIVRLDACHRDSPPRESNKFYLGNSEVVPVSSDALGDVSQTIPNLLGESSYTHSFESCGTQQRLSGVEKLRKTLLSIFDFVFGISDISVDESPVEISRRLTDLCNKAYKDAILNGNRPVRIYLIIEGVDELIRDANGSCDLLGYSLPEQNGSHSLYTVEDTLTILVDNSLIHMFLTTESIRGTHFIVKNMIPICVNTNIKYADETLRGCVERLSQECTEDNTKGHSYIQHGLRRPSLEAMEMIMKSLTPNHAALIRLLGALMLQSNMKGVSKKELLTASRKAMIVTTVDRMQTLLTEFLDHKIIVSRERCEPGINEETTFYLLNYDKQTTELIRDCDDLTRIFSG